MSEQRAQPGPQQQPARPQSAQPQSAPPQQQAVPPQQQAARPPAPQQGRAPRADLSRDELRAHLANVESQIKSALRIIASESKGTQQAHSALRADLSSALVRLQADMNGSASDLTAKIDRLGAEVSFLNRQRRIGRMIFLTFGMTLSFILGVLVIVSWFLIKEGGFQATGVPLPIEEMFERGAQSQPSTAPTPVLEQTPSLPTQSSAPPANAVTAPNVPQTATAPARRSPQGIGILPPPVQSQPLAPAPQPRAERQSTEQAPALPLPPELLTPNTQR